MIASNLFSIELSAPPRRRPWQALAARGLVLAAACLLTASAFAHSRWIEPSHTILSGDEAQGVTFDLSVSNDIFHPDFPFGGPTMSRSPLSRAVPTVTRPDGSVDTSAVPEHFARKSVFDVDLAQDGTYTVEVASEPMLLTFWGRPGDQRGGRGFGSKEQVAEQIPDDAVDITTRRIHTRIVTWVTRNAPTKPALSGQGLELAGVHPNDLFAGESLRFRLLLDGQAAPAGTEIQLTRAGTRHRNDRNRVRAQTDAQGTFEVTLPEAGYYLLEAETETKGAGGTEGVDSETYSLFATLEVQPQ
ncbi:MAG: DUF4198 domain-containing protein [Acidobacteriota bacterium]|nr:DUF4198 domain-containing protein [Acidobacteriota bacterium]